MGNCLRRESATVWAGDDWESVAPNNNPKAEKQSLLGEESRAFSSSANREVKIKITKKQLDELLNRVDVQDMPVDQVLSRLMNASDRFEIQHQRSWRPALQSIPEVN